MAEIGTIIAIIQLADRVIELSKYWIEGVRDAESGLRSILIETSMIKSILENVRFLSDCSDGLSTTLVGSSTSGGPLGHCQRILDDIITLIPTRIVENEHQPASDKDKLKLMVTKLGWATKKSKAQKLLDELQRYKAAINLALITESLQDIKEIKTKANLVLEAISDAEKREFCQWYQRTNPSSLHNWARERFEEGTCEWIQRMPEWRDWLSKKHRCLWVHGIPGAGKTILASYMVRRLESYCENQVNSVALYYYCYFANNQNEAAPLLRWIITELCRHTNPLPASAYKTFKKGHEPNLPELLAALAEIIEPIQTVYIVVDALDESKPRDDLLKVLRDLVTDSRFQKFQVAATSREYIDIERALEDISTGVAMSNASVTHDIAVCVKSALQNGPKFKRWSKELLYEVESTLAVRAKGMFRWAICQLDRLQRLKGDATAVRKALSTLPRTLDETYQRIFAEIPEEDRETVRLCLGWIDFHNDVHGNSIPVTILLQALNLAQQKQDGGFLLDQEDLKEVCGCLINISPGFGFSYLRRRPSGTPCRLDNVPVVTFAHYTVREFLSIEGTPIPSPTAYFALGERLHFEITRSVLLMAPKYDLDHLRHSVNLAKLSHRGSRHIESDEPLEEEAVAVFTCVLHSFTSYCALTILDLVSGITYVTDLSSQPGLHGLILDFLDPSHPHIANIRELYSYWGRVLEMPSHRVPGPASWLSFWQATNPIEHSSNTKSAMHLFTVLGLTSPPLSLSLMEQFLREAGNNGIQILETPVKFGAERTPQSIYTALPWPVTSSLLESIAARPFSDGSLKFILNMPGVPSSPDQATAMLQAHSVAHRHGIRNCGQTCNLNILLEIGANPHGASGYATKPIQRAAGTLNWEGIEILICAGANVNDIGEPAGIGAAYDFDLDGLWPGCHPFKSWTGRSALWIFYHHQEYRDMRYQDPSRLRTTLEKTAHTLIRHGAKALRVENGEIVEYPEIRDILMRPYEEWNLPDSYSDGEAYINETE